MGPEEAQRVEEKALAGATFQWMSGRSVHGGTWRYAVNAAAQQIQASSYNDMSGLQTENTTDTDGGYDLGYSADGS